MAAQQGPQVITQGGPHGRVPIGLVVEACAAGKPGAVALYALVEGCYADQYREAWPSRRTLAGHLGVSVDTLDRTVRWLVDQGWLQVEARWDDAGDQTSNLYRLLDQRDRTSAAGVAAELPLPGSREDAAQSTAKELNPRAAPRGRGRGDAIDPEAARMARALGVKPQAPTRTQLGRDADDVELHYATDTEKARVKAQLALDRDRMGFAPLRADVEVEQ